MGSKDSRSNQIVLDHLQKYLNWARTEEDPKARRDLEKLLNGCVD